MDDLGKRPVRQNGDRFADLATTGWPFLSNDLYCQVFHKSVKSLRKNPEIALASSVFPSVPTTTSKVKGCKIRAKSAGSVFWNASV